MNPGKVIKGMLLSYLLLSVLPGCVAPVQTIREYAPTPEGFLNAKWGISVEEVKKAIEVDRNQWFQDRTDKEPFCLYASGEYFDSPAIFSYFFTPKSKKLYRVDVTFNTLTVYGKAKEQLIQRFRAPSFSQPDVDHWSWEDKSLVILQRDSSSVQVGYFNGPYLVVNQQEGMGSPRE